MKALHFAIAASLFAVVLSAPPAASQIPIPYAGYGDVPGPALLFSNGTGIGIYGQSNGPAGSGVVGWASNPNGTGAGVLGSSSSPNGFGVWGRSSLGIGVYGRSGNASKPGIKAENAFGNSGIGLEVSGSSTFSGTAAFNHAIPFTVGSTTRITNLNSDLLDGEEGAAFHNASNLNAGTLSMDRIAANAITQSKLAAPNPSPGRVLRTNGSDMFWDNGDGGGVTQINQGTGITLTPSPITGTGSVAIDITVVPRLNSTNSFTGTNTFNSISGSGAGLTNLNASNLASGTVSDSRLSSNVATLSGTQTFTGQKTFSGGTTSFGTISSGSINASGIVTSTGLAPSGDLIFSGGLRRVRNGSTGATDDLQIQVAGAEAWISFWRGSRQRMRITDGNDGPILGDGPFVDNGIDYAEAFKIHEADLEPGDVVSLDIGNWEYCRRTATPYDAQLLGVVSTRPGFVCGLSFDAENAADPEICRQRDAAREAREQADARGDEDAAREAAAIDRQLTGRLSEIARRTHRPIAFVGRVPCKVDGSYGAIRAGDRITSSPTPGHAMKQTGPGPCIGVALEDWTETGSGKIIVLVRPGWSGGPAVQGDTPDDRDAQVEALERRLAAVESALQGPSTRE